MVARASGYHYVTGKDGKKHRVYNKSGATRSNGRVLRGRGGYYDSGFVKTMKKYVPKGTFKETGQVLAGPAGRYGGKLLSKILGFGDYHVQKNSLIDEGNSPAAMHSTSSRAVIRHREYIADVISSATPNLFNNTAYPINPGLPGSLPWLAPIAQQYEQYMIKGMVYEFKSMSSDTTITSNSFIGGVVLATDYNPLNGGFTNKQQMENSQYTTSCKISESVYHAIECAPNLMPTKQLYVRSGAIPPNADQRLYDLGTFNIATFGIQSNNQVLGELWCSYEVELIKPVSVAAGGGLIPTDHFQLGGVTNATPMGSASVPVEGCSIGGIVDPSGLGYAFPVGLATGTYLFNWGVSGSSATVSRPTVTVQNGTARQFFGLDSSSIMFAPQNGVSSQELTMTCVIQVLQSPCVVIFGAAGTLPASVVSGDLWVTQIDADIDA